MAHVAISRDFICRVEDKITIMKNAEIKALGAEPVLVLPTESPVMVNTVWGEHLHLRNTIPEKWKETSGSIRLTFVTTTTKASVKTDGSVVDEPVTCQFSVSAPQDKKFDMPPKTYWHDMRMIPTEYYDHPDFKVAVEYGNAKAEVDARWDSIRRKVVGFFLSCKSMGEAVKLWPECKMYIDSNDIARFETKVTKSGSKDSQAAEILKSIDTDELVGAAVAARFTGVA